jgi:hypothetical protein
MQPKIIGGPLIQIIGSIPRHKIVKKVVNTFIKTEYKKKGKGVIFRYPVEDLPGAQKLYIVRPGHKKNFDFKVEVDPSMELCEGRHKDIANDLRKKKGRESAGISKFIPSNNSNI